ncbi:putative phosphatase [Moellerella wisconsensis]|nr:putative phosphatase [Moellerella wisconsensis]
MKIKNYIHGKPALESLRHFMPTATEEEITTKFRWVRAFRSYRKRQE